MSMVGCGVLRRATGAVALVVAVALAGAGCGADTTPRAGREPTATPQRTAPRPAPRPAVPDYRLVGRRALPRSVDAMLFEVDRRGHVFMSVAPASQGYDAGFGRLVRLDARHSAQTFARTVFRHGHIGSIATTRGGWVAWSDTDGVQSASMEPVRWRIWAKRVGGHRSLLLASSGDGKDRFPPFVQSGSDGVAWSLPSGSPRRARSDVWAWRPGHAARRVAHRLRGGSQLALEGHRLIYLGAGADGRKESSDCWQLDLRTGRRTSLSRFGLAMDCVGHGRHAVFTGHIPKNYTPEPADGYLDDPFTVWHTTAGHAPQQVEEGYLCCGPVIAGTHFIAWNPGVNGLDYAPYGSTRTRELRVPEDVSEYAGNGDWIAFLTNAATTGRPARVYLYHAGRGGYRGRISRHP